ncbi:MAG: DNA polymerase I [Candidatus Omnitrophica bacterium]|jgi:DNA polymerase-1|nr:DNA polymerase I [Candidatus Omnitrophota bacterium]MDD5724688.1 DNA polymerase I [Candidatus Omnitrophota bacterium]
MAEKSLFLIDATAFCYRAYYALSGLATSGGQKTNAVYGFINILKKILKENRPDYLVCCFDLSRETFRSKKFAQYKMQRPAMPDDLVSQIPLIKEVVRAYGVPLFEKEGFEADDLIASLARKAASRSLAVTIVSNDKDILQLVNKRISVLSPRKEGDILYDPAKVQERFGVPPEKVAELIALTGDTADNIPGIPGVGEKTAQKLIREFGSLEGLLKEGADLKPPRIKEAVREHAARIKLNRELILLDQEPELNFDLEEARTGKPDYESLRSIFKKLEFKRLLGELPEEEKDLSAAAPARLYSRDEMEKALASAREMVLYGTGAGDLVFAAAGKFFCSVSDRELLRSALSDPRIKKTGHDLKKLKVALFNQGWALEGLGFDVMIASYLLNPSRSSYALEDLALENLEEFIRPGSLGPEAALSLIIKLKPALQDALKEKNLSGLFSDLEMPLAGVLAGMEEDGTKLDLDLLKNLSREIEDRLVDLVSRIYRLSGTEFNINSPKQLAVVLFEKLKLPVFKKTKTGASTDEEVLRRLSRKHPLPELLLEYRQLAKLKNTYVDALPKLADPSGKVHTSFNQTGTETGRLSSSNPNLQNIPVKTDIGARIRQAVIASGGGNCLLSSDYSQIELRVLAHLCGDGALIDAFSNNRDVHRLTASLIYGVDESGVENRMREVAKRVNFGIIYGQSSYGLSRDLDIPVNQAQDFIDAYFLRYPLVKGYIDTQVKKAQDEGFVTTLLGRRRYIPEINSRNIALRQFAQRQAVNTPIQGTASDLIKLAMIRIAALLKERGLEAKMILQVHDELVFDLPASELEKLSLIVKKEMENVMKLDVPIKVDMKRGLNWLEMSDFSPKAEDRE